MFNFVKIMIMLKFKSILTLYVLLSTCAVMAQEKISDTIYINKSGTYIMFNNEIDFASVGNNIDVFSETKEKLLLVKSKKEGGFEPCPLLVKYGSVYFNAILMYKKEITEPFVVVKQKDYDEKVLEYEKKQIDFQEKIKEESKIRKNIEKISFYPEEINSLGIYESKVTLMLTNIRTDDKYLYLRFSLINNSSFDYEIDYVRFNIIENKKKEDLQMNTNNDLKYILSTETQNINRKSKAVLIYALPNFAPSEKGGISFIINEKNGSRKLNLFIDSKHILNCKKF